MDCTFMTYYNSSSISSFMIWINNSIEIINNAKLETLLNTSYDRFEILYLIYCYNNE